MPWSKNKNIDKNILFTKKNTCWNICSRVRGLVVFTWVFIKIQKSMRLSLARCFLTIIWNSYFRYKKKLFLLFYHFQMIGTVIKYELVLLDEVNNYGDLPDVCHHLNRWNWTSFLSRQLGKYWLGFSPLMCTKPKKEKEELITQ